MAKHFDTVNDGADVTVKAWQRHDGLRRVDRAGQAGARRVPRVAARPALVRRERPDRTRRHPARRARRRLRRRLLPRRARGVQQRQPPAVHAVRRRAPGGLLQREHGRLQPDGDPRARRPGRPPAVELGPVRDGGEVRGASRSAAPRASRSTRPWPGWRRSSTPAAATSSTTTTDPTSLAFSDESTQDALETILTLFRDPKLTLSEEQLDREVRRSSGSRRARSG